MTHDNTHNTDTAHSQQADGQAELAFTTIVAEPGPAQWRACALDADGYPVRLEFFSAPEFDATGALFHARVTRVDANLDLAFLDLGDGRTGVMNQRRARLLKAGRSFSITESVAEGERLLVQAVHDRQGAEGKAISVTPKPRLAGRYVTMEAVRSDQEGRLNTSKDLSPADSHALADTLAPYADGTALIVRANAAKPCHKAALAEAQRFYAALTAPVGEPGLCFAFSPQEQLLLSVPARRDSDVEILLENGSDVAALTALARSHYPDLADSIHRFTSDEEGTAFDILGVDGAVEEAVSGHISLPSGGWIGIHQTPALTVIDVNMGQAYKASDAAEAKLMVNQEAALAVAYHIQFQNIGGLIVIDFIDMTGKGRIQTLMDTLAAALREDSVPVSHTGLSAFGLLTLNRPARGLSLRERMMVQPSARPRTDALALELLRRASAAAGSPQPGTLVLSASARVQSWLEERPHLLTALSADTNRAFVFEEQDASAAYTVACRLRS